MKEYRLDEYSSEFKWDWFVDMLRCGQSGFVSRLLTEVPKPKKAKMRQSLPMWDLLPLHCRLPELGIKGLKFSRGKAGESLLGGSPNTGAVDFITYDPYCYEHDSKKYDSLHDPHLIKYFKSKAICKFLRKVGILDKNNYPKCSAKDMNSYRIYLNRIHKDMVKSEHERLMTEKNERKSWKNAHQIAVNAYFKNVAREEAIMTYAPTKRLLEKQERARILEPIQRMKRWDRRQQQLEEQQKENAMMRQEIKLRKSNDYNAVLARGRVNARKRPVKTLVKMRDQKLRYDEMDRKRKQQQAFDKSNKEEAYLMRKTLFQINKIEMYKQLATLRNKGRDVQHERYKLKIKKSRNKFKDKVECGKRLKLQPKEIVVPKHKRLLKKVSYREKVHRGLRYTLDTLKAMENQNKAPKDRMKTFSTHQELNIRITTGLEKAAKQLIRRAVFIQLNMLTRNFATQVINYCMSQHEPKTNQAIATYTNPADYFPGEHLLKQCFVMPTPKLRSENVIISETRIVDELRREHDTTCLRSFLTKRRQYETTLVLNARRLVELVFAKTRLLKTIGDPYNDVPLLKREILRTRKVLTFSQLLDKTAEVLAQPDPAVFDSPMSGLGTVANILAYINVIGHRNIIGQPDLPKESAPPREPIASWETVEDFHRYMHRTLQLYYCGQFESSEDQNE